MSTPVVQLERECKIITDTFKMVAYRAETQLANLVGPLLSDRDDEARNFMRQVFALPADLHTEEKVEKERPVTLCYRGTCNRYH